MSTLDAFPIFSYNDRGIMHLPREVRERHMGIVMAREMYAGDVPGPALEVQQDVAKSFTLRETAYVLLDSVTIEPNVHTTVCGGLTDESHELLYKRVLQLYHEKWKRLKGEDIDESG
ncbi:hypothetical protein BU16DRAFT_562239 [Lophium mytilinum]|uniref:Uncharacterized protein n=1 Tax=Lophium mytilinum TaxID=390894 RepID=A0A6A6QUI7_9PEZI|nr:hypothetical protein BU16DRAFT_562239 [Lophium mytilinum]